MTFRTAYCVENSNIFRVSWIPGDWNWQVWLRYDGWAFFLLIYEWDVYICQNKSTSVSKKTLTCGSLPNDGGKSSCVCVCVSASPGPGISRTTEGCSTVWHRAVNSCSQCSSIINMWWNLIIQINTNYSVYIKKSVAIWRTLQIS
jgi:hypothetical protein